MFKRVLVASTLIVGGLAAAAPQADAGVFLGPVAPVRRVFYPPYPMARRVVAGPVYRPVVYGEPMFYGPGAMIYGSGVSVVVGY
jgi:hypothetical protein